MSNYSFANLADFVLLWLHGRRFGIKGDGQGPFSSLNSSAVLDGAVIGSPRSGPNAIKTVATALNGVGSVVIATAQVGDNVEFVLNLTGATDLTSSFESRVSVAGQVKQTSASNLSGDTCVFHVQPQ